MSGLVGPSGVPLGRQPVVAHIITVPPGTPVDGIRNLATYWQQALGVPAIVMAEGARLVGAVLADGELVELPPDDGLTVKVQALLDGRTA